MLFKCVALFMLIVKVLCENIYLYEEPIGTLYNFTFKNIEHKNNVQLLDLRGNGIESISNLAFSDFDNLVTLVLSRNKIKCLHENVFNYMQNIDYLGLDLNKIKYLHKNIFSKLGKLKILKLQHNLLSKLEVGLFKNNVALQEIILHDNQLTFIPNRLFNHLGNLKTLNLAMNNIYYIDKFALPLMGTSNIFGYGQYTLMLFANKLQHFDFDEEILDSLTSLTFDKNPLYCDCKLKQIFKKWKSSFIDDGWMPACDGPKHMKNRVWATLKEDDFICNKNEITFSVVSSYIVQTGENVNLLCHFNNLVNDITITYKNETKVIDQLRSNKKLYSIQFFSAETISLYNLTIKNIQINDGGNYKCLVNTNEEPKIEKIITLTVEDPDGNVCCDV